MYNLKLGQSIIVSKAFPKKLVIKNDADLVGVIKMGTQTFKSLKAARKIFLSNPAKYLNFSDDVKLLKVKNKWVTFESLTKIVQKWVNSTDFSKLSYGELEKFKEELNKRIDKLPYKVREEFYDYINEISKWKSKISRTVEEPNDIKVIRKKLGQWKWKNRRKNGYTLKYDNPKVILKILKVRPNAKDINEKATKALHKLIKGLSKDTKVKSIFLGNFDGLKGFRPGQPQLTIFVPFEHDLDKRL